MGSEIVLKLLATSYLYLPMFTCSLMPIYRLTHKRVQGQSRNFISALSPMFTCSLMPIYRPTHKRVQGQSRNFQHLAIQKLLVYLLKISLFRQHLPGHSWQVGMGQPENGELHAQKKTLMESDAKNTKKKPPEMKDIVKEKG